MMLANSKLRVSLVTIHLALNQVSPHLTREKISRATLHTFTYLRERFGIKKPRIAVIALNPHAGEGGMFGQEEIQVIQPAILAIQKEIGNVGEIAGAFPADTFFARQMDLKPRERFDAVICMYHDQGLIPVKLLDFHHTVNVTLGLPIIRTSVDHGTGFDIAGRGVANPSSMLSAIELAEKLRRNL
jgi:4-hydroxythreonine-4-phosphate dehydrogenase